MKLVQGLNKHHCFIYYYYHHGSIHYNQSYSTPGYLLPHLSLCCHLVSYRQYCDDSVQKTEQQLSCISEQSPVLFRNTTISMKLTTAPL